MNPRVHSRINSRRSYDHTGSDDVAKLSPVFQARTVALIRMFMVWSLANEVKMDVIENIPALCDGHFSDQWDFPLMRAQHDEIKNWVRSGNVSLLMISSFYTL